MPEPHVIHEQTPLKTLHYLFCPTARGHATTAAYCLDLDLVTVAEDPREAERKLNLLVEHQLGFSYEHSNFYNLCFQAPQELWEKFHTAPGSREQALLAITFPETIPFREKRTIINIYKATVQ